VGVRGHEGCEEANGESEGAKGWMRGVKVAGQWANGGLDREEKREEKRECERETRETWMMCSVSALSVDDGPWLDTDNLSHWGARDTVRYSDRRAGQHYNTTRCERQDLDWDESHEYEE